MAAKVGDITVNNPYGRMVLDDYLARVREIYAERAKRIAGLRTRREAERYRDEVAEAVCACFGPFPKRTPLNAEVTGVLEESTYRIEKIKLESRPGFWVTGNFYVPNKLKGRAPGVLGSCGHADVGKAAKAYQAYAYELAQNGFAVLIFDPMSQGERDQFHALDDGDVLRRSCTQAHNAMGKQLDLAGDSFGNWRAWDAIRVLDYLESREEVDPKRLSMTGNSGGGTMSLWMWALDRRLRMVASSCFVTSFLNNFENELPQDAEQYPTGMLARGLDMADFLIARAPDPALVIAQRYCFFDRRGAQSTADEVGRVYSLLKQPKHFSFFLGAHDHGYHEDGRIAMRRFFCGQEDVRFSRKVENKEKTVTELQVTEQGQVVPAGGASFQQVFGRELDKVVSRRKPLDGAGLRRVLARVLNVNLRTLGEPQGYRILRSRRGPKDKFIASYAIRTERSVEALVYKVMDDASKVSTLDVEKEVTLYVPDLATELEIADGQPPVRGKMGYPYYSVDVRGLGASMPDEAGDFLHFYGMDYMFHGLGVMLNESYTGRRVFDLLQVVALLKREGARRVRVVGRGKGALLALFATALDDSIDHAELHETLRSLEAVARDERPELPASFCPHGILRYLDLPDLYRAFGDRLRVASYAK